MSVIMPMTRSGKCQIGAAIDPELYRKFALLADKHNVSIAAYLRAVIVDVVEEEYSDHATAVPGLLQTS